MTPASPAIFLIIWIYITFQPPKYCHFRHTEFTQLLKNSCYKQHNTNHNHHTKFPMLTRLVTSISKRATQQHRSFNSTKRVLQEQSPPWYKKVYRGAAYEHRIQLSVGMSIVLCACVIPLSIMRIKQLKNREAPVLPDQKGQLVASLISQKLRERHVERTTLNLQALKGPNPAPNSRLGEVEQS